MRPRHRPGRQWASIPDVARWAAERFGDAEAVVDGARRVTFAGLWQDSERAGKAFIAAGVEPGDRVAIWAQNSYEWVTVLLGLQAAGAAVVPLNTRFRGQEAAFILNRSRARILVTAAGLLGVDYLEMLAPQDLPHLERRLVIGGGPGTTSWEEFLRDADCVPNQALEERLGGVVPDNLSDIIFTSGTTGAPKGVTCTHGQSIRTFEIWSRTAGLQEGDRYLLANPMFHTFGYKAGILACLMEGATMIPVPVFDAEAVLDLIATEHVSAMPGPPTLYQSLLASPRLASTDTASLRLAVTGAAVIPVGLVTRMREELGFETVLTAYGLTEATGFVTATSPTDDLETIATTSGRAIEGVEVVTVDARGSPVPTGHPGEVWCRGFNVTKGYYEDPEQTAATIDADGWLHTGDVGVLDEGGNLRITDRIKDMFIVGGFNAYPAEIENLLLAHPGIAQVAVVGVADERLGEVGVAFVVPRSGAVLDPAEVVAWARQNMANYKAPRTVHIVGALPLNASGKVLKFELRERAGR